MYSHLCLIGLLVFNTYVCDAQRVAPGVPPQHYQQQQQQQYQHQQVPAQHQQVPVQQHQQVPVQQHQVPVQHQQVPVQQQQVPVQQQQVPVQQTHGHPHGNHNSGPILTAANLASEKAHIQEHMEVPMDTSKMSEAELQFHYFKMHDADNNNKLDGNELIKSLIHWHEQGKTEGNQVEEKIFKDDELVSLIDPILNMDDSNRDGYIDYPEFVRAQKKASVQKPT